MARRPRLPATHNFSLGVVVVVGTCARGGRRSSRPGPRIANAFVPRRKPPMPPWPAPTEGTGGSSPAPLADVPAMAHPPLLRVRDPPAPPAPRRCSSRAASPRRRPTPTHHRVELSWNFWKVREGRGRCVRMRRGVGVRVVGRFGRGLLGWTVVRSHSSATGRHIAFPILYLGVVTGHGPSGIFTAQQGP